MFAKKTAENAERLKRYINYVFKCNLYLYLLIEQKLLIFDNKMMMSEKVKGRVT